MAVAGRSATNSSMNRRTRSSNCARASGLQIRHRSTITSSIKIPENDIGCQTHGLEILGQRIAVVIRQHVNTNHFWNDDMFGSHVADDPHLDIFGHHRAGSVVGLRNHDNRTRNLILRLYGTCGWKVAPVEEVAFYGRVYFRVVPAPPRFADLFYHLLGQAQLDLHSVRAFCSAERLLLVFSRLPQPYLHSTVILTI